MSEQSKSDTLLSESISALVDNEASELELARILKASSSDVSDTWSAYQVAGAVMRRDFPKEAVPSFATDFSSRVSAAIAEEPAHEGKAAATPGLSGWWLGLSRMAVAASVAAAVVVGVQFYDQTLTIDSAAIAAAPELQQAADTSLPIGFNAPALSARTVSAQYGAVTPTRQVVFEPRQASVKVSKERIRAYLDQLVGYHTDHAAINSAQGMLPYARMPLTPSAPSDK